MICAQFEVDQQFCRSPYEIPADVPASDTVQEAYTLSAAGRAYARTELVPGVSITGHVYNVSDEEFALVADVTDVLDHHGPGLYTVQVWATLEGEPAVISAVSVFHEVEVPEGYGPR